MMVRIWEIIPFYGPNSCMVASTEVPPLDAITGGLPTIDTVDDSRLMGKPPVSMTNQTFDDRFTQN